jgi:hypothetical protein
MRSSILPPVSIRHLRQKILAGGRVAYYWEPAPGLRKEGCPIHSEALGTNLPAAIARAEELNRLVDAWRSGNEKGAVVVGSIRWLIRKYEANDDYRELSEKTRRDYSWCLGILVDHVLKSGRKLGDFPAAELRRRHVNVFYEQLLPRGPVLARAVMRSARILWNFGIRNEYLPELNPFARMGLKGKSKRSVCWSIAQVEQFAKGADKAGYPSMALAAWFAFELCQREGDTIRCPKSAYSRDSATILIKQRKTSKRVAQPLKDLPHLMALIEASIQRHPQSTQIINCETTGRPYTQSHFQHLFAELRGKAGLPAELWFEDLRRSGMTEAGNAGATSIEIQGQSGHVRPDMLEVYVLPGSEAAGAAIAKRQRSRRRTKKHN